VNARLWSCTASWPKNAWRGRRLRFEFSEIETGFLKNLFLNIDFAIHYLLDISGLSSQNKGWTDWLTPAIHGLSYFE
jgi:hypothetical protein